MTFDEWCTELANVVGPALFTMEGEVRLRRTIDLEAFYKRQSSQESVRSEALQQKVFEKWWNDQEAFVLSFACKGTAWNAWQAALIQPSFGSERGTV